MNDLVLEPYAVRQVWSMRRPLEPGEWGALFAEYLSRLASACDAGAATRRSVIGHIKLLALFTGHEYLRVSAVSAVHPPTIAGAAPAGLAEVAVTLNVLVYGLPREQLASLTSGTAHAVAEAWAGTVHEQTPTESMHHAH